MAKKKSNTLSNFLIIGAVAVVLSLYKSYISKGQLGAAQLDSGGKGAASSPLKLSPKNWKIALIETKTALSDKNLPMLAAGVAYFATLAFFPTLAAFISIFALVAKPAQVSAALTAVGTYLPHEMSAIVTTELRSSLGKHTTNIIAAIVAIILSLWSSSSGMQNFMKAVNSAYDVQETRNFIKLKLVSLALVLGGIVLGFPLLALVVLQGNWLAALGAPLWLVNSFLILRWVVVALIMAIALAVFYRYAPNRKEPKWQWVSWGALAAIVLWLLGTLLFFFYAQNLGNFSKNYGTFAGIIVLMTWLNLSAFIFLLGATVNHRLETRTIDSVAQ